MSNDVVAENITHARIKLLMRHAFLGSMAIDFQTRIASENEHTWCKTMSTDGTYLYINRDYAKQFTVDELCFLFAHLVYHAVFEHIARRNGRKKELWDFAIDLIVNSDLISNKVGTVPSIALVDKRFTIDMTVEDAYELLEKNGSIIDTLKEQGKGPVDHHMAAENDQIADEENCEAEGAPSMTPGEIADMQAKIFDSAMQALQSAQNGGGAGSSNTPDSIVKRINDLLNPKLDWKSMLDAHLRSAIQDDLTFFRMSRRDLGGGMIAPAMDNQDAVEVHIAMDCSGSMSDEMFREILSETKGIMQSFNDFKLVVWQFDTRVVAMKEFTPHNIDELDEYSRCTHGGTLFECNWEFMKMHEMEPHRFVMFTDGYPCDSWGDPDFCETLFVIHGNKEIVAPFGLTAYYDAPDVQRGAR